MIEHRVLAMMSAGRSHRNLPEAVVDCRSSFSKGRELVVNVSLEQTNFTAMMV